MNLLRTLIVGNSGSGKSWLAERIANRMGSPCIDLDSIHWLPGGYNVARERNEAIRLLRDAAKTDRWVIEGIYGSLVNEIRSDSTALIWLCPDETECVENIRQRGVRRGGDAASFDALLDWASTYRSRQGPSSYIGHQRLFGDYGADKKILGSRDAIMAFLDRLET
ncbi:MULTISPECIES: adenylate kinase [Burkholderia]|uniref:adenylate kinase n=1 Tax=Burkholderia TaxID=32008 RepID=UPI001583958B|nr:MULTISPECIES: adenylate kinase [Burkholderia]